MKLLPTVNKSKLVKLLRHKGYDVPGLHSVHFEKLTRHIFLLEWVDRRKQPRRAVYFACAGRPYLKVGEDQDWLTMAEVISFGLVEEK